MFDWFNRKTQQVVEAVNTTWKFVEKPSTLLVLILAQLYIGGFYYLGMRAAASTPYGAFLVG
ncbi:hypothetical protein MVLG_04733 [Microbotryum lychnidis-dioicae p1A1 Lamole]|uniref:Uncharacterized protein n=2 Tax=Microbotryum TaxID=34416 RepID=U5HC44_USTV1|nr:hypothetical protein MVLG_04733 [Microbotryum lychnidis-dioicae p1A1 Lamole]SGY93311.1 BQ5605_C037g11583 [Microbotryum silenes-dioicae]|eukprot:KDE04873.1 hypothetical protein MVLG_04733 [Microbotryum lychnidis-dioicae p1A1 Lamole]